MNNIKARCFAALLGILPLLHSFAAEEIISTNGEFSAMAQMTIQLLQTGDAKTFAQSIVASEKDWQAVRGTNTAQSADEALRDAKRVADYERQRVSEAAQHVVDTAKRIGLDTKKLRFELKEARTPANRGSLASERTGGKKLDWYDHVTLVLSATPIDNASSNKLAGEYALRIGGLMLLPVGWRSYEGIQWNRFPASAVDEQTQLETKIAAAVDSRKPITASDDPALAELGKKILRLLRDRDEKTFIEQATLTIDDVWNTFQKSNRKGPSRQELESEWPRFSERIVTSTREAVAQAERWGVDFGSAEVKEVKASHLMYRGAKGSLENLEADAVEFTFNIQSDKKAKTGAPISGTYTFGGGGAVRVGGQWKINDRVRWQQIPKGVVDATDAEKMEFENHVAEHGTLPPGSAAPDIEFVRLDNQKKEKLSDYRGKLLIVDFWATWCGPCQQPMAELQTLRAEHPEWKDNVEIMSLSIDDTAAVVQKHLTKKGWTNTFNLWAGPGGWASNPAKVFRVTGVPTTYIIGKDGKIINAGHPAGMRLSMMIPAILKQETTTSSKK